MKQTISIMQERPLLTYAISKLNPVIFSHPVWIRFGRRAEPIQSEVLQDILDCAEELQRDNPADACQLMFICAAYQSHASQWDCALTTIKNILDLATRVGLPTELQCAYWGACAVCFQQQKYDQAACLMEELEVALTQQNEWVLADFVNVIRQTLCQPEMVSAWKQPDMPDWPSSDDLFHSTCLWLQKWGLSFQAPVPEGRLKRVSWYSPDFFRNWRRKWNGPRLGDRQLSVWLSIRSLLRLQEYDHMPAPESGEEAAQQKAAEMNSGSIPTEGVLKPAIDISATKITSPKPKGTHKKKPGPSKKPDRIALTVQMLGNFSFTIGDTSPKLPASRALSVFKYFLLHHKQDTPREVLMDLFWPDAEPEAARNNLNVAMHNLRQLLQKVTDLAVICFEEGTYRLASNLEIWLDVEEFDHCVKEGRQAEAVNQLTAAIAEYEIAINLYHSDLLADSPYEEWLVLERERLRVAYLDTLDRLSQIHFSQERYAACVTLCRMILDRDICREDVHCRVMRCYSRLGQDALALRQYQACIEALHEELDVEPAPEMTRLYEQIRRHQHA